MWYEGQIQNFEDVNEDTVLFFLENEDKKREFAGVDSPDLLKHEDLNYIGDNTKMPWIPVDIHVPWKEIFDEANHLLYTSCYTLHRPDSAGWLTDTIPWN